MWCKGLTWTGQTAPHTPEPLGPAPQTAGRGWTSARIAPEETGTDAGWGRAGLQRVGGPFPPRVGLGRGQPHPGLLHGIQAGGWSGSETRGPWATKNKGTCESRGRPDRRSRAPVEEAWGGLSSSGRRPGPTRHSRGVRLGCRGRPRPPRRVSALNAQLLGDEPWTMNHASFHCRSGNYRVKPDRCVFWLVWSVLTVVCHQPNWVAGRSPHP